MASQISTPRAALATSPNPAVTEPTELRQPLQTGDVFEPGKTVYPRKSDGAVGDFFSFNMSYIDVIHKWKGLLKKSEKWPALEKDQVISSLQNTLVDLQIWAYDLANESDSFLEFMERLPRRDQELKARLQQIFSDIDCLLGSIENEVKELQPGSVRYFT